MLKTYLRRADVPLRNFDFSNVNSTKGPTALGQDWLKTSLILTPVMAIMVGAGYYLWLDYQARPQDQSQAEKEVFGTVSFVSNNVKRKTEDSPLWTPLSRDDKLYFKDSIRTGAESYAALKLRDNTVIELNENSLIVLEQNSNQLNVDFKIGDIRTKAASKNFAIKVKDTTIQSQGAELKLKSDAQKAAQITVTKGKATVTDAQKVKKDVGPESVVTVDERGKTQTAVIPLILQSPSDKAQYVSPLAEIRYPFTWTVLDKEIKEEFLEISEVPEFTKEKTVSFRSHQNVHGIIKRGVNYWRVAWKDKAKQMRYSEARLITLTPDQRLTLTHPADKSVFEFNPNEGEIEFTWAAENEPKYYVLEISDSPAFRRILKNQKLSETKATLQDLRSGLFYWRVSAFGEKNENLGQSGHMSFEIKRQMPKSPQLIKPENASSWTVKEPVRFSWQKVVNASHYRLRITKDKEQRQIIKTVTVQDEAYAWPWEQTGTYFWSVESLNPSLQPFTRSDVFQFTTAVKAQPALIKLFAPADNSEVLREKKEPIDPISFEWGAESLNPAHYTLMLSKTQGFEKFLKTEGIQKNRVSIRLPESGTYYWKVIWKHPNPQTPEESSRVETSPVYTLKYNIAPGLPAPVLIAPAKDAVVKVDGKDPVDMTWKPVNLAKNYRVVLERFDARLNTRIPVADKIVETPQFTSSGLEEGTYEWRVYTVDQSDIQGLPTESRKFIVQIREAMLAPKLKAPEIK